jgi:hypothetical protein
MNRYKTEEYIHPCIYTISQNKGISLYHSKIKNGHFGIPKVIWSNGLGTYPIIDLKGEYGLTQFSYAIIDDIQNLKHIENVLNNPKFIELMEYVKFQDHKYNYKVISLLRHDFWKVFIDTKKP